MTIRQKNKLSHYLLKFSCKYACLVHCKENKIGMTWQILILAPLCIANSVVDPLRLFSVYMTLVEILLNIMFLLKQVLSSREQPKKVHSVNQQFIDNYAKM